MHDKKRRSLAAGMVGIVALLVVAGSAAALATAQPRGPSATDTPQPSASLLPPEAQAALDAFLQNQAQPQQRIPFPVYQVALPLLTSTRDVGGAPGPEPTPQPAPAANPFVTLRPNPSIRVARSGQLAYLVRVRNAGQGSASQTEVTLPISPAQLTLRDFSSEIAGDFVSQREPDEVTVTFAALDPGAQRAATLLFDVSDALPDDTVISTRATFTWEDARDGGARRTNWAPVLVGDFNNSSRYLFLELLPASGPPGTFFNAYTDRFIPNEPVTAWLNTPEGVQPLERDLFADSFGRVQFSIDSAGLAPGGYELVLYGQRSRLTAVQGFVLE